MTKTSTRRGYRNDIGFGWLLEQAIRCCRNLVHNWQESMDDSDVFCLFANSPHFGKKDLKDLVLNHFGPDAPFFDGEPGVPVPEPPARNGKSKRGPELPEGDDPLAKAVRHMQKRRMRLRDCGGMADTILDIWNCEAHRPACRAMLEEACDLLLAREARTNRKRPADPMEARVDAIASFLGLDPVARDVFVYAAVRDMTHYGALPRRLRTPQERIDFIAMATDRPDSDVARALRADAPLRRFEVLDEDTDLVHGTPIWECLQSGGETLIESRFYKRTALDDALPLSFHGTLAERHAAILKALLAAPAASNGHAPNILFYGSPGTGKTSFAKTLVRELGYDLVEIRQGDANGHISPTARFTGIRLCNEHFPAGRVVVLVDEADELLGTVGEGLFGFLSRDHGRKGVVNATLDDAKLPAIWIANTPADALDESVRRRFAYSIRFEPLDGQKRLAIWRNTVGRLGLEGILPSETVGRLSSRYPVNAGGIATALESLKRIGPAPEEVEQTLSALLEPHCELLGIRVRDEAAADSADYSVEGLNVAGEIPPERVLAAVRKFRGEGARSCSSPDRPRLNILLYGPPGTGKTEFVRHLARESGAKLDLLTGSSLLGPYVGETEARIREAFHRAAANGSILFLDEMDGLMMDRASSSHRWELTQVNELLHGMEDFGGIFVGATNYMDRLDPAVLRRFTFKLRFGYLDATGKRLFFERMFKAPLDPESAARLDAIPSLAPGDYRTVRQSFHYLDDEPTAARLVDALARESALKPPSIAAENRPFGFAPCGRSDK